MDEETAQSDTIARIATQLRSALLELGRRGLRMPIGVDLVLHEHPDPDSVRRDGGALGRVVEETARRFDTPLALPLMDLTLDKDDLLSRLAVAEPDRPQYHFHEPPPADVIEALRASAAEPPPRSRAQRDAIRYIATRSDLIPFGMAIGPFSLATKLMADPITAFALAGRGLTPEEDESVALAHACLELAEITVARSVREQLAAGAQVVMVCEPAASTVFISPRQLRAGSRVFEDFVMQPNRRLSEILFANGAELFFHDCGELTRDMVAAFAASLDPAVLSLGSSRDLSADAAVVPDTTVLFGNLPTKTFYSDEAMPDERVAALAQELAARMAAVGHPFILGSECDVLHVGEAAAAIRRKVDIMLGRRAGK